MSRAKRLETWSWVFIYAGLLSLGLGVALVRGGAAWGWTVVVAGSGAAVAGVVMIWLRSRMPMAPDGKGGPPP
jgi:hypothetical protein